MFLTKNVSAQVGTMSLVPQVVDAVKIPVIAAGGIADARGLSPPSLWVLLPPNWAPHISFARRRGFLRFTGRRYVPLGTTRPRSQMCLPVGPHGVSSIG